MSFLTFWWSLGPHIIIRRVEKPLLQEPSVSKYSFFLGRFSLPPPLQEEEKGETLCSVVLFPCFCQRHRASCNFSTRKEEVDACVVHVYTFKHYANQPRPHAFNCMRVHNHYFTFRRLPNGPQAERTPLEQTHKQNYCCTKKVTALHRSDQWPGLNQGLW